MQCGGHVFVVFQGKNEGHKIHMLHQWISILIQLP